MPAKVDRVVIIETPNLRLVRCESEKGIGLYKSYAPIPPYPSRVYTEVYLYKGINKVHGEIKRDEWDGCGSVIFLDFKLDEETFNSILEAAKRVNDISSFEQFVKELQNIQHRLENKALDLFDSMTAALENIQRKYCAQDKKPKKRKTKKAES